LYEIHTNFNPEQPIKALSPILVTLFGMTMEVNPERSANAPTPILVTVYLTLLTLNVDGIVTEPDALELVTDAV
jgi:hypothetical protein